MPCDEQATCLGVYPAFPPGDSWDRLQQNPQEQERRGMQYRKGMDESNQESM